MPRKRNEDAELQRSLKELDASITRLLESARRNQDRLDGILKELRRRARARRRPRIIAEVGVREPYPWELTVIPREQDCP
jgi:hypothetical protein